MDDTDRLVNGDRPRDPFQGTVQLIPGEQPAGPLPVSASNASLRRPLVDLDETLASLKERHITRAPSLIGDGVLKRGRIGILYGPGGGSKTWLTLRLAIAVSCGDAWLGLRTEQGRVGIISFEMFAEDIQSRLAAVFTQDGKGLERIFILTRDNLDALKIPASGPEILEWALDRKLDLIIIDPLSETLQGTETNEFIAPIIDELRRITLATGAAVILIHHTRKGGTNGREDDPVDAMRGPSQLRDRLDLLMYLEKRSDKVRRLTFTKVRNAPEPEPIWVDSTGEMTDPPEGPAKKSNANRDLIRQILRDNPETSFTDDEIVSRLRLSQFDGQSPKPQTVRVRYLPDLVRDGFAIEIPPKRQREKKRWRYHPGGPSPTNNSPRQPLLSPPFVTSQRELVASPTDERIGTVRRDVIEDSGRDAVTAATPKGAATSHHGDATRAMPPRSAQLAHALALELSNQPNSTSNDPKEATE